MTLILNGTDNSATTPAVTGTDTDTGIYYPAANQVAIATNGTQAMLVDASQNATFAGYANLPNTFGFKNRIINGAMVIDQRNAGASVTQAAGNQYSLDRWNIYGSAASKFTFQQNAGAVTPPAGYTNYLGITSSSAYSVSSTDIFMIRQFIEGYNIADLGWGAAGAATVTLSFWVRSSLTGTFGGVLQNYTDARAYPFTYTISAANTWEQKTVTVTGDTSGTWSTTNTGGITVTFGLGVGSSKSTTANSWAAGGYYSATGATSVVGTSGATFYITGVQLEKGSTATSFDYRSYGTELVLCQRYYEYGGVSTRSGNRASGTYQTVQAFYKAQKRTSPTFTISGGYTSDGWGTYGVGAHNNPTGSNDTLNWGNVEAIATSAVGASGVIACNWTSSAEL